MNQQQLAWGRTPQGDEITLFTLVNDHGVEVSIMNYGATITSIKTPDKQGVVDEIVLGFDSADAYLSEDYIMHCPYFGAAIGRYANRIGNGLFAIDGQQFKLAKNNLGNALHGGNEGFDKRLWKGKLISEPQAVGAEFYYLSPHGEEGYPGNLEVWISYILCSSNKLEIRYEARTDLPTILNLTNHTYFNLTSCKQDVLNHYLTLYSHRMIETENLIPTGNIIDISDTVFDFSKGKIIGDGISGLPIGYDCGYSIAQGAFHLNKAAKLEEFTSGRKVHVFTSEPSLHLYSGFHIPETSGHKAVQYGKFSGVALETQHFPDSPNHPHFPTTVLQPGQVFKSQTIYLFGSTDNDLV
jgi:aldose 1-epimerase